MSVILGVDYGERRIGLAVSDELMIAANPLDTIARTTEQRDLAAIEKLVRQRNVERIVVGLPLNMDGSEGPMAKAVREFAGKLSGLGIEIEFWDERLSTRAAESTLLEADFTRKKRKGLRDKVAAAWLLQGYLDARKKPG